MLFVIIGESQVEIMHEQKRLRSVLLADSEVYAQTMDFIFGKSEVNPLMTEDQEKLLNRLDGYEEIIQSFEKKIAKM